MMIRTRLKMLASAAILLAILAIVLVWWRFQQVEVQQRQLDDIQQLQLNIVDLDVVTLDLLNDADADLQKSQWQAIYDGLGGRIEAFRESRGVEVPGLAQAYGRIGRRFGVYLQALSRCRGETAAGVFAQECTTLLGRLKTQVRISLQELLMEIGRDQRELSSRMRQQFYIGGILLLVVSVLAALLTLILVLPMVGRLNTGLTRLLEAGERFGSGDLDYRLPVDGQDEMAVLARTYNQIAQRRQQVEARLRDSERRQTRLLNTLPYGVQENDTRGVIIYSNVAHHRILGLQPGELIGRQIWDFQSDPGEASRLQDLLARLIEEQPPPKPFVTRNLTGDGRRVTLEITWDYVRDVDGLLTGFISVISDVTDRERAARALKRSESNLVEAQRVAQLGSWELDLVDNRLWWSDQVYRIFGIDRERFGASYEAFLNATHPDDREWVNQAFRDSLDRGEPYDIVHRLLLPDGRIRYVNERCKTDYDETGRPVRSLGTVQDITERYEIEEALRENEARYRQLVENMSDGVAVYEALEDGADFVFKEHNPAGERITGLKRNQVIGRTVTEAFPGVQENGLFEAMQRVWHSGRGERFPVTRYHDQRISLWVENHLFKLPSGELVAIYEDATRRKLAEDKLRHRLVLEAALAQVSTDLAQAGDDDLDQTIDRALEQIGRAVGVDRSYLFLVDEASQTFSNTHEWCAEGIAPQKPELQMLPLADFHEVFLRFRRGEALIVSHRDQIEEELAKLQAFMQETGIQSLVNVPMVWKQRLLGVVGFDAERNNKVWPEEDVRLLHTLAESFAAAFERWETSRHIREHAWFLESLDRVSRVLTGEWEVTELQHRLMDLLLEIFDADRAWLLYPCDPEAPVNQVRIESARPQYPGAIAEGEEIARTEFSAELKRKALVSTEPLVVQIDDDPAIPDYVHRYRIKSMMMMVLRPQLDEPWLLGLHQCSRQRHWSEVERRLFQTIAERVGSALSGSLLLEKVRENERRLLEAERIAQTGSWERDLRSNEAVWSDQEYLCLGYQPQCCTASFERFLAAVHPEDKTRVIEAIDAFLDGKTEHYDIEHRVIWQDGSEHVVHQRGVAERDASGVVVRVVGTTQDITARVLLERELEAHRLHLEQLVEERTRTIQRQARIIDQTHDSVVTTDLEGFVTSWNRGSERLFGIPAEQAIGRHISLVYSQRYPDVLEDRVIAPLMEKGVHEVEAVLQRADGSEFPVHLSLSLLHDEGGQANGMVGYAVDISELKRREQDLRRLSERLQAANRELESFSYSVSHDLRAPLRAIDGFSLALIEDYGSRMDSTGLDYLQRVRNGAQRMGMLIDDMLQLSRVNRTPLQMEDVDLSAMARSVMDELRAGEPERKVTLTLDPDIRVRGDPRQLRMLLDNLLGNAWKFTSREEMAHISFRRMDGDPKVFYIQDNGVGFDMRHADKLFGAFQRLHQVSDFPGTGIGLATVQRIINRHGGSIWARAEEGKGATFYFSLDPAATSGNGSSAQGKE